MKRSINSKPKNSGFDFSSKIDRLWAISEVLLLYNEQVLTMFYKKRSLLFAARNFYPNFPSVSKSFFTTNAEKSNRLCNRFYRCRRNCPKMDASILDTELSHTRRSDASKKLLDVFACGQVSSLRLYRLTFILSGVAYFVWFLSLKYKISSSYFVFRIELPNAITHEDLLLCEKIFIGKILPKKKIKNCTIYYYIPS